jgi:hypothetical protein
MLGVAKSVSDMLRAGCDRGLKVGGGGGESGLSEGQGWVLMASIREGEM